jgi:YHS domain-containing protein
MIKLHMLALAGFFVYSMLSGLMRQGTGRQKKNGNRSREGEQMVADPQCGTYIPISDSVKATINGQLHYFCSKKCLREYKKTQKP